MINYLKNSGFSLNPRSIYRNILYFIIEKKFKRFLTNDEFETVIKAHECFVSGFTPSYKCCVKMLKIIDKIKSNIKKQHMDLYGFSENNIKKMHYIKKYNEQGINSYK